MSIILVRFNQNNNTIYRAFSPYQNMSSNAFIAHLFHHLNMYNENPFHSLTPYGRFLGMHIAECDTPLNERGDLAHFSTVHHHIFSPVFFTRPDLHQYTNNTIESQDELYSSLYRNMSTVYTIGHARV